MMGDSPDDLSLDPGLVKTAAILRQLTDSMKAVTDDVERVRRALADALEDLERQNKEERERRAQAIQAFLSTFRADSEIAAKAIQRLLEEAAEGRAKI